MLPRESWPGSGGIHPLQRQAGRCADYEAAFDPDSKQGGNTNLPALLIHILAPDTVEAILDRQQPRG
jgi:hypothetical protein